MPQIERSSLVPYSPEQMFHLVRDVRRYPEFLKWCETTEVHHDSETELEASITVAIAGVRQTFTTRNRMQSPHWMTLGLVDGPFRSMDGRWSFADLGGEGCKVTLHLAFEFSSSVLSGAFSRGFAQVAQQLVADFSRRAADCYGRD